LAPDPGNADFDPIPMIGLVMIKSDLVMQKKLGALTRWNVGRVTVREAVKPGESTFPELSRRRNDEDRIEHG